jgi:hypothetical protein
LATITISQLPALPTLSQQLVTSALTNNVPDAKKQVIIDESGVLGYSTTNAPMQAYSALYLMNNSTATTINALNTPVPIDNTNFVSGLLKNFEVVTNNTLKYLATDTKRFLVTISIDVYSGTNDQVVSVYLYKNGTQQNNIGRIRQSVSNNLPQSATLTALIELQQNDLVNLYCENNKAVNNVVIANMSFVLTSIN